MQQVTLSIDGMTCGHCVQRVRGALAAVPGVEVRSVRIGAAQVTLDTPAAAAAALAAVHDAGYAATVDAAGDADATPAPDEDDPAARGCCAPASAAPPALTALTSRRCH